MGSRRTIDGASDRAYRVVEQTTYQDGRKSYKQYSGPYSKLSAAKGRVTTKYGEYSENLPAGTEIWIEQTPEGWEKVEI